MKTCTHMHCDTIYYTYQGIKMQCTPTCKQINFHRTLFDELSMCWTFEQHICIAPAYTRTPKIQSNCNSIHSSAVNKAPSCHYIGHCGAANTRVCMHIPSHTPLHTHPLVKVLHVRNNPTATEILLHIGILAFVSID